MPDSFTMQWSEPSLLQVIKEITEKLLNDDWYRVSAQNGDQVYYIVGSEAQSDDLGGRANFCCPEFPLPVPLGPISDSIVRSQVADNKKAHLDHLKEAKAKLVRAGMLPTAIDRFLEGDLMAVGDWYNDVRMPPLERMKLLNNLLEALAYRQADASAIERIARGDSEVRIRREKNCLKELANKYPKIVARWEQLEPLSFADPQLLEASKAFLYGFYRASIVLCASAVEKELKRICRSSRDDRDSVGDLRYKLGDWLSSEDNYLCKHLFWIRNEVVHHGYEPSSDDAKAHLGNARSLVAALRECPELT
jgi:hypothetical protein